VKERLKAAGRLVRRSPRMFVLGAAAVLAVGGVASAAIPDSDDQEIHGCYQKNQGQLRVIDAEAGDTCRPSEEPLTWNQEGPQGPAGPEGPTGPRGPSDAFSRFHDAEVAATDLAAPRLLELPVPAGRFATTATAIVRNAGAGPAAITCQTLHPSGDFDLARATLAPTGQPGDTQTLAMNPVGFANAPGTIWLDCTDGGADVMVSWMKITSIQVATLTNTSG
jgi:hypothetical protein